MGAKRDTGEFVLGWAKRERDRAESLRSQAADLERRARDSDRRAAALEEMLDASDFLNASTADDEAGF